MTTCNEKMHCSISILKLENMLSQCYLTLTHCEGKMDYIKSKNLRNLLVKLAKEHSSFLYFILEANDNIVFYSTLSCPKDSLTREVDIFCAPELSLELDNIIHHFQTRYPLEVIRDEVVSDL